MKFNILGLSASLRNARFDKGNDSLIQDLSQVPNHSSFIQYIKEQVSLHVENYIAAGSKEGLSFDVLYRNLKKQRGDKGLSNSEAMLAAALWAAQQLGASISHFSLKEFFSEDNKILNIEILKNALINADGILISTPVYFGDRSSLVQSFIDLIRNDETLKELVKNKIFGGLAVGAKRNGGQETTLIYQLWDMINLGFLGIGNDSETTAQYGGTGLAGDIGSISKDEYGLSMAMGVGRRIARVTNMLKVSNNYRLNDKIKILFWILQDKNNIAASQLEAFLKNYENQITPTIMNITEGQITRCLACDICPTKIDIDQSYRCIVKRKSDYFVQNHNDFIDCDAIVPVALCAKNSNDFATNYQKFMERTRYLRRGDYLLTNIISAPLVFEEIGSNENLAIRILTSTLRHHSILMKPLIIYLRDNNFINLEDAPVWLNQLIESTKKVSIGRVLSNASENEHLKYNPIGYVLSSAKDQEDSALKHRKMMLRDRFNRAHKQKENRLELI